MAQEGWSVQRLLRIIQSIYLKETKAALVPDKKWRKQEEPQLRFFLVIFGGTAVSLASFFIKK
jgi:putative transposase